MKKILTTLISLLLLFLFFSPALAQIEIEGETAGKSPECCLLKHTISVGNESFGPNGTYGPLVADPNYDPNDDPGYKRCPLADEYSSMKNTPYWAGLCALDAVITVAETIRWVALVIVATALIVAGLMFIFAGDSPERLERAKKTFRYSLIGVLIAGLSYFIPGLARYFIGI